MCPSSSASTIPDYDEIIPISDVPTTETIVIPEDGSTNISTFSFSEASFCQESEYKLSVTSNTDLYEV